MVRAFRLSLKRSRECTYTHQRLLITLKRDMREGILPRRLIVITWSVSGKVQILRQSRGLCGNSWRGRW